MSVFLSRQINCLFNEENSENKFQPQCESESHHSNGHGKSIEGGEVLRFKFTTRVSQMWPLDASVAIFPYHIARCVKENITLSTVWKKILHAVKYIPSTIKCETEFSSFISLNIRRGSQSSMLPPKKWRLSYLLLLAPKPQILKKWESIEKFRF